LFYYFEAKASSVSYTIINSTSTDKVSVSVNTILKRDFYDCSTTTFICEKTKEQINERLENPLKEITVDFLIERDKTATTSKKTIPVATTTQIDYRPFIVPQDARFVTYSPDGKMLAYFTSDKDHIKTFKNYNLLFEDGRTLGKFGLSHKWELVTDVFRMFGFNSSGDKLVYIDDRDGSSRLYIVHINDKTKNLTGEPLIKKNYTVLNFIVKGDYVYFIANREGPYYWGLYSLNLNSRKLNVISKDVMYTNDLVFVGDELIFTENVKGMGVLKSFSVGDGKVKSFSGISQEGVSFLPYKIISKPVRGIIISPEKEKNKSKAIIWLHGGPYRQASLVRHPYGSYATFDWILDEMVRNGITVLKLDYPGSMGYGIDYTQSLVGKIGEIDVKYVSQAIDFLKNSGIKNIYLFGNSYGGYLSIKGLVELDKKLSGAVAVSSVTDWKELLDKLAPTPFEVHFNGVYNEKNATLYKKSNILENLDKLTKPLVILHGDLDKQVPFSQSELLLKKSVELNKDVKYYSVLNQAHVISGVSQNEAICNKVAEMIGIKLQLDSCVMK
jgi:dipeptidyl aminopeptidase/acylaminoacyl peptidase